jgi:hypothetical protein
MPHSRYRGPPMTLVNMRENSVRSLSVMCEHGASQMGWGSYQLREKSKAELALQRRRGGAV